MSNLIRLKMNDKEVQLESTNNVLTQSTVKSQFLLSPDSVVSLSYEVQGRRTGCHVNAEGTSFLLPESWPSTVFFVEPNISMGQTSIERPSSPYHPAVPPDPAPTSEAFIEWMFYLYDTLGKASAICIHPRYFITFRHGSHLQYKIGDTVTIYRAANEVTEQTGIEACVVFVNEEIDYVMLRTESDVVKKGPPIVNAKESEPFTLAGFGNEKGSLSFLPGTIHSTKDYFFAGDGHHLGPFILGTSRSARGCSGGGVWGSRGLLGMNSGCTAMPLQPHQLAISEAATFSAKNIICPSSRFKIALLKQLEKEKKEEVLPPPRKKPAFMTEYEGIGTLYGGSL